MTKGHDGAGDRRVHRLCVEKDARFVLLETDDVFGTQGVGIETAYGVGKMFKKTTDSKLKEWGVATGFFAAAADS